MTSWGEKQPIFPPPVHRQILMSNDEQQQAVTRNDEQWWARMSNDKEEQAMKGNVEYRERAEWISNSYLAALVVLHFTPVNN